MYFTTLSSSLVQNCVSVQQTQTVTSPSFQPFRTTKRRYDEKGKVTYSCRPALRPTSGLRVSTSSPSASDTSSDSSVTSLICLLILRLLSAMSQQTCLNKNLDEMENLQVCSSRPDSIQLMIGECLTRYCLVNVTKQTGNSRRGDEKRGRNCGADCGA